MIAFDRPSKKIACAAKTQIEKSLKTTILKFDGVGQDSIRQGKILRNAILFVFFYAGLGCVALGCVAEGCKNILFVFSASILGERIRLEMSKDVF